MGQECQPVTEGRAPPLGRRGTRPPERQAREYVCMCEKPPSSWGSRGVALTWSRTHIATLHKPTHESPTKKDFSASVFFMTIG